MSRPRSEAFYHRATLNGAARTGAYAEEMERESRLRQIGPTARGRYAEPELR